jgi:hypothetical protein
MRNSFILALIFVLYFIGLILLYNTVKNQYSEQFIKAKNAQNELVQLSDSTVKNNP